MFHFWRLPDQPKSDLHYDSAYISRCTRIPSVHNQEVDYEINSTAEKDRGTWGTFSRMKSWFYRDQEMPLDEKELLLEELEDLEESTCASNTSNTGWSYFRKFKRSRNSSRKKLSLFRKFVRRDKKHFYDTSFQSSNCQTLTERYLGTDNSALSNDLNAIPFDLTINPEKSLKRKLSTLFYSKEYLSCNASTKSLFEHMGLKKKVQEPEQEDWNPYNEASRVEATEKKMSVDDLTVETNISVDFKKI